MKQEVRLLIGIGAVTAVIIVGAVIFLSGNSSTPTASTTKADPKILIREDSDKMGSDSAKVKFIEFGDYQCPSCGQAYPVVKEITTAYKDKIQFVFRNFPLSMHPNAPAAAEAAEAAGAQGKYWQMHDMLYENQNNWVNVTNPADIFIGYAKSLGLDANKFKNDITSSKYAGKIQEDVNDGNTLGVNATPTFYINNQPMIGVQSYIDLKNKIDVLLK